MMFVRSITWTFGIATLCVASTHFTAALAAPPAQQTAKQEAAAQTPSRSDDAAKKAAILNSPQWRRAMFEFKEWLSVQQLYDQQQVAQLKDRFNRRVAAMSASELEFLLQDMEAKFKILDSPQAREARSWVAQYLSVMSDKKRAEVLKDLPNPATMTAAQLNQELTKIEGKRATINQEQAAFAQSQQALVSQQLKQDRSRQQAYVRESEQQGAGTLSPYRNPSDVNRHLNNSRVGGGMGFYVNPWGGVGMMF